MGACRCRAPQPRNPTNQGASKHEKGSLTHFTLSDNFLDSHRYGTVRADFPGGDAHTLYYSIQRLLAMPLETRLFMCHDYKALGRDHYAWETTVAEERARNVHVHQGVSVDEFVAMRQSRDATLPAPMLLLPSIQVNIHAGHLPEAESN